MFRLIATQATVLAALGIIASAGTSARAADFDGDRKADIAIFTPIANDSRMAAPMGETGVWSIRPSHDPSKAYSVQWGQPGDIPLVGDFDGDGITDLVVFSPASNFWSIRPSHDPSKAWGVAFGQHGDIPLVGDFDGDGKSDIAVFSPVDHNTGREGAWSIRGSRAGIYGFNFGEQGDVPFVGDFDGDGKTDVAVFKPRNSMWSIRLSTGRSLGIQFGAQGDIPAVGDIDGDGKTDIVVFTPSTGIFSILPDSNLIANANPKSPYTVTLGVQNLSGSQTRSLLGT